jgi:hypothetical protein
MTTDIRKDTYNKFENLPLLSSNCIEFLMNNNELIWKLLQYTDRDAYKNDSKHPNLTKVEKAALIYNGMPNQNDFKIFLDVGQDDAITTETAIMRIHPMELVPVNHIYGNVSMAFECYAPFKSNTLSNHTTRIMTITQQIIETFNGQEIGGLGRLYFDARASSRCRMTLAGQTNFKGNVVVMCNWI